MSEATTVEFDHEADIAEANRIMREAGWQPGDEWDGEFVYKKGPCVGGWPPGPRLTGYVKNIEKVRPGHPRYGDPAYPDTRAEAAQWLVDTYTPNLMTTEATLDPPVVEEQTPAHETHGEDAAREPVEPGEALADHQVVDEQPEYAEGGAGGPQMAGEGLVQDEPIDADFTDLDLTAEEPDDFIGEELLDDFAADLPALEGGDVSVEAPQEHPGGQFIFGDNLAHDRIVRIGQLTEHAARLIAAVKLAANWRSNNEFLAVQSHVVVNMDKVTGAYTGGDAALYSRFVELSEAQTKVRDIEAYRDAQADYVRTADRDMVALFDPEAGWP